MKLRIDTSRSYALALEGGGAKGAYQIGAWKALREAGVKIDAVAGTSVGALNGSLIVMGDLEKAENIWENIRYSQVMDVDDETMSRLLKGDVKLDELDNVAQQMFEVIKNRGFDVTPLRKWISQVVDEKTVRESPVELFIDTFSLSDGKLLELRAKDLPEGTLCDMLLASAYLPVFRSEKLGGKRYADGGLRDVLPLHVLIEHGYKDILALRLFGIGVERSVKIPEDTRVYTVEPTADLGSTLEFEPAQSRENLRAGYYDMQRFLYGLRGTKYYVDCDWDETKALSLLSDAASAGESVSLRTLCEKQLPALAKRLDAEKGDYIDLAVALVEAAAEHKGVDPWQIVTADALLELAGGGAALAAAFAEPAARKLARQGGTARRPRRCWVASGRAGLPPSGRRRGAERLSDERLVPAGRGRCGERRGELCEDPHRDRGALRRGNAGVSGRCGRLPVPRRALSEHRHDEDDRLPRRKPVRPGSRGGACGDGL